MPPRTVFDDPQAELEHLRKKDDERRRQARDGMRRLRAERRAARLTPPEAVNGTAVRLTGASKNGRLAHPPQTPPSPSLSKEREEIRAALEPFVARGYAHSDRYWELAAEEYPLLRLELEALKLADWLLEPKNAKKLCSTRRIDNWLKTAEADRQANQAKAAAQANGVASPRGIVTNGTYHPPITQQHNRQPDAPRLLEGELLPISKADFERTVAARRAIPLPERLAALSRGRSPGGKR